MGSRSKWVAMAAVACLAAAGGVACSGDSSGGGGSGGICDPTSSSFDQAACIQCSIAATTCMFGGVCGNEMGAIGTCESEKCPAESEAVNVCADAATVDCAAKHPDDFTARQDCIDDACEAEDDALSACGQAKCASEADAFVACFKRDCPDGAACFDSL